MPLSPFSILWAEWAISPDFATLLDITSYRPDVQSCQSVLRRIRILLAIVITGLIVSAILSLPLLAEATMLDKWVHHFGLPRSVTAWIEQVHEALHKTYGAYPFVPYGTDWLAFGHFVIAFFVLGAFLDPVRNVWIIRASLIACLPVVPTALIAWRGARSSALVAGHRLFFWHRGFPSPRGCR